MYLRYLKDWRSIPMRPSDIQVTNTINSVAKKIDVNFEDGSTPNLHDCFSRLLTLNTKLIKTHRRYSSGEITQGEYRKLLTRIAETALVGSLVLPS